MIAVVFGSVCQLRIKEIMRDYDWILESGGMLRLIKVLRTAYEIASHLVYQIDRPILRLFIPTMVHLHFHTS